MAKLACFSFAAYAKTLINQLNNLNIPILPGLTDNEFSSLQSSFGFSFPPDLRSILQEGLPIAHHFPNWRSSSPQQLQILLNLPILNLSRNILHNNFWLDSWGPKPQEPDKALALAKKFFAGAPVLVPVYGNCYIAASPNTAGNPVFYIDHTCVHVLSFDLSRFFQELEFFQTGGVHLIRPSVNDFARKDDGDVAGKNVPAWAATAARRIEFWTELAERGRTTVARVDTRGWWRRRSGELGCCLEEVFWKLRDGGWKEEEVKEMMMMMDGCDDEDDDEDDDLDCGTQGRVRVDVARHVRVLSLVLLQAGWSREEVAYSLDLDDSSSTTSVANENNKHQNTTYVPNESEDDCSTTSKCLFDFQISTMNNSKSLCSREEDDHQNNHIKQLVNLHSLQV
ncbi:hypothetical protein M5689_013512 [Euphorbia peplus]|nr:hypothetical protein M5689_013512 [Euphorbia peplus]